MRHIVVLLVLLSVSACKVTIVVPETGSVVSENSSYDCGGEEGPTVSCTIEVNDIFFDETFVARPDSGYRFAGWKKRHRGLCGGTKNPCRLQTIDFQNNPVLLSILEGTEEFFLEPVFEPVGVSGDSFIVSAYDGVNNYLQEVSQETGELIGEVNFGSRRFADIEYVDGTLYGVVSFNTNFFEVDYQAGSVTRLANLYNNLSHLASHDGEIFAAADDEFYSFERQISGYISVSSWALRLEETTEDYSAYKAITFDDQGNLYAGLSSYDEKRDGTLARMELDPFLWPRLPVLVEIIARNPGAFLDVVDMELTSRGLVFLFRDGTLATADFESLSFQHYAKIEPRAGAADCCIYYGFTQLN